jgi:tRNA pseudouridine13 synthase
MKDKHAVTTQWISVPVQSSIPPESWVLPDTLAVVAVSRHQNKLRTGHLLGNRFAIRLVGVDPDAVEKAKRILARIELSGFVNYFGAQRFGNGGRNLSRALEWVIGGDSRRRKAHFDQKLLSSVIQAEIFNRYANARSALPLDRLVDGEVVRLEGSGSVFVIEDPEKERARLLAGDIHLTGPILGPKMKAPQATAAQLEDRAVRELSLEEPELQRLGRAAAGTRRDLLARPTGVSVRGEGGELFLEFFLPAGSYATEVIRELTRGEFLSASR